MDVDAHAALVAMDRDRTFEQYVEARQAAPGRRRRRRPSWSRPGCAGDPLISVLSDGGGEREAALPRCDLDGACELAAPVVRTEQDGHAYELARQFW